LAFGVPGFQYGKFDPHSTDHCRRRRPVEGHSRAKAPVGIQDLAASNSFGKKGDDFKDRRKAGRQNITGVTAHVPVIILPSRDSLGPINRTGKTRFIISINIYTAGRKEYTMKNKMTIVSTIVLCASIAVMTGCGLSNALKGGGIGAGAGGVAGGVIGHHYGNTALGAIIGAAVGGTTGALIGRHMDKQAEEMRQDIKNAKIERVGEGIKITFDSGILFEINSSELQSVAKGNIESLAKILNKYPDTNILIEGDTDNTGSEEYNQKLSERRAQAVADYQKRLGVAGSRISTVGLGELNPIASNDSEYGREQNRRVEVAIFANDKLKNAAEDGKLN
jgi:outer membrane protein OmpA-like peptidoglycan-associated protein